MFNERTNKTRRQNWSDENPDVLNFTKHSHNRTETIPSADYNASKEVSAICCVRSKGLAKVTRVET